MKKMMLYVSIVLMVILVMIVVTALILSPGKIKDGYIEELEIGGLTQSIFVSDNGSELPVLLFLHGGPGSPEYPLFKKYLTDLENDFVIVHLEQRGSGKSYDKNIFAETMNIDQFVLDVHELTSYLKEKNNQEKIYLMGHSWGTFVGMKVIDEYPEDYEAYFGIGNVVDTLVGEELSINWLIEEMEEVNDEGKELVLNLYQNLSSTESWIEYIKVQRGYVQKYGGGIKSDEFNNFAFTYILSSAYTVNEKMYFVGDSTLFSIRHLWNDLIKSNLREEITEVDVPVYFFQGEHDYQTPTEPVLDYFNLLKAPRKSIILFNESAHNPHFEESAKFITEIRKVIY